MLVNEAVASSRIEGTHTTVQDVLVFEAGKTDLTDAQRADIQEVMNYCLTLNASSPMLEAFPISGRILWLVTSRGTDNQLGWYRQSANCGTASKLFWCR